MEKSLPSRCDSWWSTEEDGESPFIWGATPTLTASFGATLMTTRGENMSLVAQSKKSVIGMYLGRTVIFQISRKLCVGFNNTKLCDSD